MKNLQQILATILLVLAIGISTYAGDISGPVGGPVPPPPPPDQVSAVINAPTDAAPGDIDMPAWETLAVDLLWGALSMY